jgi:hypothetical protein
LEPLARRGDVERRELGAERRGGTKPASRRSNGTAGTSGAGRGGARRNGAPSAPTRVSVIGLNDRRPARSRAVTTSGLAMKWSVVVWPSLPAGKVAVERADDGVGEGGDVLAQRVGEIGARRAARLDQVVAVMVVGTVTRSRPVCMNCSMAVWPRTSWNTTRSGRSAR